MKQTEEFLWVEKYRPKTVAECILPDRIKKTFQDYVDMKSVPNLLLTGTAGVGKTTIAKALCEELDLNYMFINSSETRGIDLLRTTIRNYASTVSLKGGRKVIILDESDYLTNEAQAAMRGCIEEFSKNCSFIFTCNFKSKLIDAIHSRCSVVEFTLRTDEKPKMAAQFFGRLQKILDQEGITYDKQVVIKLIEKFFPDYRRTLNELQRHSSSGNIDAGTLAHLSDVKRLADLIGHLKNKNFTEMRKWAVTNSDIDTQRIYRRIYDGLSDYLKPESIPQAVIIIARYQYQASFVPDLEINLVACLTELMVECDYV